MRDDAHGCEMERHAIKFETTACALCTLANKVGESATCAAKTGEERLGQQGDDHKCSTSTDRSANKSHTVSIYAFPFPDIQEKLLASTSCLTEMGPHIT